MARRAARLRKHEKELTVFPWEDAVDGTNNAAERALRPAVVMRKITGGKPKRTRSQSHGDPHVGATHGPSTEPSSI